MDWVERFELGDLAAKRPGQLSGGEAQRVGLARALASAPALLLLDEPLSSMDAGARGRMRRLLSRHLAEFDGPRVLITHDAAEASLLADQVVVIEDGSVTQSGTPGDLLRAPRTAYAADLAGLNLLSGSAAAGAVSVAGGLTVQTADTSLDGDVLLTIHPRAVAIHVERPGGSPRNAWRSAVTSIETLGDLCRVQFEDPVPLIAEITAAARLALGLEPGTTAWVAIKATEIQVLPD